MPDQTRLQSELARRMAEQGLSMMALCRKAGLKETAVRAIMRGTSRNPRIDTLRKIAAALQTTVEDLTGEADHPDFTSETRPAPPRPAGTIPEIDGRIGAGLGSDATQETTFDSGTISADAAIGHWSLPETYLREELRVGRTTARIISVVGDSMSPTLQSGDRVMIDTGDRRPSPPGVFALWDGFGIVVKRIEIIPRTDPVSIKIISDNPRHSPYELTAEEINIIGRVVWYGRRL